MILAIFFPVLSFLGLLGFGRFFGKVGTVYWVFLNTFSTILGSCFLYFLVNQTGTSLYFLWGLWLNIETFSIYWEFVVDSLSVIMLIMVSLISGFVHFYSIDYMKADPHFIRFMSFLSLFTFFMFILVTAANFVQLFVGWEGVGICSYLLINFWTTRLQANKAAIKAVIMNRIGDIGFIIGLSLLFNFWHSIDFDVLFIVLNFNIFWEIGPQLELISFFFLIGVIAKSAQIGLHTWLPAAMEGPTPVSALIHAATMVTAGIFLIIRSAFLFEISPSVRALALLFGVLTAFLSALTAVFLYDIKRIIAYSTCSQLGYMLIAASVSQYHISLFHLINHAFFKALLFITAGAIIHSFANEQDIRKLGMLYQYAPLLYSALFIGNMAIMGLPFLAGFYSKDLILEVSALFFEDEYESEVSGILYLGISLATCLTAVYSCRLVYYVIFRQRQFYLSSFSVGYLNQPIFMRSVLVAIIILSIFSGYLFSEFFLEINIGRFPSVFMLSFDTSAHFEMEFFLPGQKFWPIFLNFFVILIFFFSVIWKVKTQENFAHLSTHFLLYFFYPFRQNGKILSNFLFFLSEWYFFFFFSSCTQKFIKVCVNNFYFNEVFNFLAVFNFYSFYQTIFLNFDKGLLEILGPTGLGYFYLRCVRIFALVYYNSLKTYLFCFYFILIIYFFLVIVGL